MMFSEWISTDERWKSEETFPQRISLKYLYAGPVKRMGNCPATFDALDISQILEKLPSASLPPQRESKSFPSDIESRQKLLSILVLFTLESNWAGYECDWGYLC